MDSDLPLDSNLILEKKIVSLARNKTTGSIENAYFYSYVKQKNKLHRVQNIAAWLVIEETSKFDRWQVMPLIKNLHWLKVKESILFKILYSL